MTVKLSAIHLAQSCSCSILIAFCFFQMLVQEALSTFEEQLTPITLSSHYEEQLTPIILSPHYEVHLMSIFSVAFSEGLICCRENKACVCVHVYMCLYVYVQACMCACVVFIFVNSVGTSLAY